jgi:hypothetical protein
MVGMKILRMLLDKTLAAHRIASLQTDQFFSNGSEKKVILNLVLQTTTTKSISTK